MAALIQDAVLAEKHIRSEFALCAVADRPRLLQLAGGLAGLQCTWDHHMVKGSWIRGSREARNGPHAYVVHPRGDSLGAAVIVRRPSCDSAGGGHRGPDGTQPDQFGAATLAGRG